MTHSCSLWEIAPTTLQLCVYSLYVCVVESIYDQKVKNGIYSDIFLKDYYVQLLTKNQTDYCYHILEKIQEWCFS